MTAAVFKRSNATWDVIESVIGIWLLLSRGIGYRLAEESAPKQRASVLNAYKRGDKGWSENVLYFIEIDAYSKKKKSIWMASS